MAKKDRHLYIRASNGTLPTLFIFTKLNHSDYGPALTVQEIKQLPLGSGTEPMVREIGDYKTRFIGLCEPTLDVTCKPYLRNSGLTYSLIRTVPNGWREGDWEPGTSVRVLSRPFLLGHLENYGSKNVEIKLEETSEFKPAYLKKCIQIVGMKQIPDPTDEYTQIASEEDNLALSFLAAVWSARQEIGNDEWSKQIDYGDFHKQFI
jgi:hypothetical protein